LCNFTKDGSLNQYWINRPRLVFAAGGGALLPPFKESLARFFEGIRQVSRDGKTARMGYFRKICEFQALPQKLPDKGVPEP